MTKNNGHAGKRRARKCIAALVLIVCMGAAIYMGYMAAVELLERKAGTDYYAELADDFEQAGATTELMREEGLAEYTGEFRNGTEIDFAALWETCPDVVGWIRIDGTVIDYPVVLGTDNQYYLSHLPNGAANSAGSIMMDVACEGDFSSMVTILHGHHMRSGAMFGDLDEYAKSEYFAEHPTMRLMTPDGDFDVAIFAGYYVNGYTYEYRTGFSDAAAFDAYVEDAVTRSAFRADVDVKYGDRIVMLSTCAYVSEEARFVVLGKIIE